MAIMHLNIFSRCAINIGNKRRSYSPFILTVYAHRVTTNRQREIFTCWSWIEHIKFSSDAFLKDSSSHRRHTLIVISYFLLLVFLLLDKNTKTPIITTLTFCLSFGLIAAREYCTSKHKLPAMFIFVF